MQQSGHKLHAHMVHLVAASSGTRIFQVDVWESVYFIFVLFGGRYESLACRKSMGFDLLTWDACAALIPGNLDNGGGVSKHTYC